MYRRLAWLWLVAGLTVACVPDWGKPLRDAGADGGGSERDEDNVENLAADAGDAVQPPADADGVPDAEEGEPGEPAADSGVNDAAAGVANDDGCADGFVLRGGSCRDIDECSEGKHTCDTTTTCENTDGGYDCKCAGASCEGCKADADCQRFGMVCHETAGICVACTIASEAVQCGGKSCGPATNACTETDRASVDICGRCVADSECLADHRCILMNFRGESRGGHCMKRASSGCYTRSAPRRSGARACRELPLKPIAESRSLRPAARPCWRCSRAAIAPTDRPSSAKPRAPCVATSTAVRRRVARTSAQPRLSVLVRFPAH